MKRRRALLLTLNLVLALCAACGVWLHVQRQQYARNRQLIDALEHDDAQQALALVTEGADPNTRQTPTPVPSFPRLIAQWLHRLPPPVNNTDTALIIACGPHYGEVKPRVHEDVPLIQAMLEHGANVNAVEHSNSTALHAAASADRWRTADLLLQHGANVNAQTIYWGTPLMFATVNQTAATVRLLLAHGANVSMQDRIGRTPLHYAVKYGNTPDVIAPLLAQGADPNQSGPYRFTPLQLAQQLKRPDLVRLLKQGAK